MPAHLPAPCQRCQPPAAPRPYVPAAATTTEHLLAVFAAERARLARAALPCCVCTPCEQPAPAA
ncbi:hypothetical protein [Melaminivora sp.]|uniref:hypothetical protein n=1 Tax=Melaminivora sp. TaxID=1933032 RepID=UPI0028A8C1D4|nr:hypothetical protein [Melaminivora sp.]